MDKARVGDIEIAYSLAGGGPPLVMIMGLFTNADWWEPELIEALGYVNSFLVRVLSMAQVMKRMTSR
ncbi:MAG: hypothetical protein KKF41_15450 [Actinobacteria bacterium]|nr:hypothetical protein [Actinomycetota bacterium]MBU1943279.1 hypothetical protein [Actinomycetota bacterium]MBU2688972.1 hypothetical protein [Actinomycetota bacterium]